MSHQNSQQKAFYPSQAANPLIASLDLQSQYNPHPTEASSLPESLQPILDYIANYIDRRFHEVQEFMQFFNKTITQTNKNFTTVGQVVFFKNPLEPIPQFKYKKHERKLQIDLKDYLKKLTDIKDDLRESISQVDRHNILSLDSTQNPSLNLHLEQSHNQQFNKQFSHKSSSRSDRRTQSPQQNSKSHIVTIEHEEEEVQIEEKDIVRSLKKQPQLKRDSRHFKKFREESEVQDDSDTELKRKVLIGNLEGFSQQRIQNTNSVISIGAVNPKNRALNEINDTDGDIITIGEEIGLEQTKTVNKRLTKNKTSRSPLRQSKNQTQSKSQNKKQGLSKYDQLSRELNLDPHSSIESGLGPMNPQIINHPHYKQSENQQNKSPFAYVQKASMQKYTQGQQKPGQISGTHSFNSSQNITKTGSKPSKSHSKGKSSRTKSITHSKSPSRNIQQQLGSNNNTARVQSSSTNFLTNKNTQNESKVNNQQFSTLPIMKQSAFRESLAQEKLDTNENVSPLQSSSGGSSTKLFESFQNTQQLKNNESQRKQQEVKKETFKPQLVSNQVEKKTQGQSPILTTRWDEKDVGKEEIKSFKIDNQQQKDYKKKYYEEEEKNEPYTEEHSEDDIQQHFEKNLKRVQGGVTTGETDQFVDGHRFTLQGDSTQESKKSSVRTSLQRTQPPQKPILQNPKETTGTTGPYTYSPLQINSEVPSQMQIMTQGNIFSPTSDNQPHLEFDLAQYNSPSFAAGHNLHQSYQSLKNQIESVRYTSSSSQREHDSGYCLQLQYDQKISMNNQIQKRVNRTGFLKLPGEVLCLLGEYLNEKLPIFIFTNRVSFKICLQYQIEFYEQQRQMMVNQMFQMQKELERIKNAKKFDLSTQSRDEYEALEKDNWKNLIFIIKKQSDQPKLNYLKQKDIIILRLYLTFMGLDLAEEIEDRRFLHSAAEFLKDCGDEIGHLLDPERSFLISEDNKQKIKELLVNLQREKLLDEESKSEVTPQEAVQGLKVVEIFTNLLFEALQFVNIIPNVLVSDMKTEIDELKKVAEAFNGIKNNLIDFKNLVA